MTDSEKLRALAKWFDITDAMNNKELFDNEVQIDLRAMAVTKEEQFEIQREILELTIKAGRRLMHDFKHLLSEVPGNNPVREEFVERGKMWEEIFYPDDGTKNYRAQLHLTIDRLHVDLAVARQLLREHGIEPEPHKPF